MCSCTSQHLLVWTANYGVWVYAIPFVIVFAETGLVVAPFLPGDSLLFVAGSVAALGNMDINLLVATLLAAAILGNLVNYEIGECRDFKRPFSRILNLSDGAPRVERAPSG